MADKKIKLSIEGQEVVCNFGVNYFYKHFEEITGIDPMLKGFGEMEGLRLFDAIVNIFYAGYKAEQSFKREEAVLSREVFEYYVQSKDIEGVNKMSEEFANLSEVKTNGEEKKMELQPENL